MNTLGRCLLLCLLWACATRVSTVVHVQIANIPEGTQVVKTDITFLGLSEKAVKKDLTSDLSQLTVELPGAGLLRIEAVADDGGGQVLAQGAAESAISGPGEHEVKLVLQAKTVEKKPLAQVRVRKPGLGGGTVTSDPPGINCGETCAASFTVGTQVNLLVKPESRSYFRRFGGACSGASCTVSAGTGGEVEVHLGARFCDELRPGQGAICMVDPPAGAPNLRALWGTSGDDLWAAGEKGEILHYDGFAWTPVPSASKAYLTGIWGSGPDDVYIVGQEKTIRRWNGTQLNPETPPAGTLFEAVGGLKGGDVWIAGETILHREAGTWMQRNQTDAGPVPDNLHAIWASGENDIWAAGNSGAMWRWKGTKWEKTASPTTKPVYALWGRDASDVWAVGYPETDTVANLLRWDGMMWSRVEGDPKPKVSTYYRVWGRKNEVFAVGIAGLSQWDGKGWSQDDKIPKDSTQFAVWADDDTVVVAGRNGSTMRKRGSGDFVQEHDGRALNGVWAFSPTQVWAVGEKGLVRRFDGTTWSSVEVPVAVKEVDFRGVGGTGEDDLWIVGKTGTILHRVRGVWTNLTAPNVGSVYEAVCGIDKDNVWLVGSQGKIVRCTQNGCPEKDQVPSGVSVSLGGVWGRSTNDVWAVGESSTVLRFDGTKWNKLELRLQNPDMGQPSADLYGVSGTGPTEDVWIVGANNSLVLRYRRASGFEAVTPREALGRTFYGVYTISDRNVWVVSEEGILHFDGQDWAYQAKLAAVANLYGVHGTSDGHIWAVGYGGAILHYPH